jgi:hypothetical protein
MTNAIVAEGLVKRFGDTTALGASTSPAAVWAFRRRV